MNSSLFNVRMYYQWLFGNLLRKWRPAGHTWAILVCPTGHSCIRCHGYTLGHLSQHVYSRNLLVLTTRHPNTLMLDAANLAYMYACCYTFYYS